MLSKQDILNKENCDMKQEWQDIKGFEGLYSVSNDGIVRSYDKIVQRKGNSPYFLKGRIMKQNLVGPIGKQYLCVDLFKDGKRFSRKVHRLVAEAFLGNPNNLPCINHKNEDKLDNRIENLEFCSYSYNNTYNGVNIRNRMHQLNNKKTSITVCQYDDDGIFIRSYPSLSEAARVTGLSIKTIRESCKANKDFFSRHPTKYGFRWRYEKDKENSGE